MKVRRIKKTLGFRGSHYLSLRLMGYVIQFRRPEVQQ